MTKRDLALELYRHFDDIERYAATIEEDAVTLYSDTEAQIRDLIYRIAGEEIGNTYQDNRKLAELKEKILDIRYNVSENVLKLLNGQSDDLISNEMIFLSAFLLLAFQSRAKSITKADMENIRKYGKYHGLTQKEIIEKVMYGDAMRVYEAISDGIANGKTAKEVIEEVTKEFNTTKRYIQSEVNTVVDGIVNDASLAFAAKNGTKLMFSSMLDDRVCEECEGLEGHIYDCDDPAIPAIPLHVKCRCHLIPVIPEKDFDKKDYEMSFGDYFESMSEKEKKQRVGSAKYAGYRSGTEKMAKFTDVPSSGRMTLADVAGRDKKMTAQS